FEGEVSARARSRASITRAGTEIEGTRAGRTGRVEPLLSLGTISLHGCALAKGNRGACGFFGASRSRRSLATESDRCGAGARLWVAATDAPRLRPPEARRGDN